MKIAKNEKGLRQNLSEVNVYKKYNNNPPFMLPMIDWDDNDDADTAWIHVMKSAKLSEGIFYRYFDVTFEQFSKALSDYINKNKNDDLNRLNIVKFIKFVKDNDLMLGEYRQKSNWGSWKEKPVIIDAGVTRTNQELTL